MKRFSQACENNKDPIAKQLNKYLKDPTTVLEIGSGTGQHAIHFSKALPHVTWQTSDLAASHEGIRAWMEEFPQQNLKPPLDLDVSQRPWPVTQINTLFTANTLHIMSWHDIVSMFEALGQYLCQQALVIIYGPFKYGGSYTSASNQVFDASLKQASELMGIRDIEKVMALAEEIDLILVEDVPMPANNQLLVFKRVS